MCYFMREKKDYKYIDINDEKEIRKENISL